MPLLLLILFIAVPLGELALLLWIAEHTHWTFPLALVVVSGLLGVALLKIQGAVTLARLRREAQSGQMPTDPLIDAGLMLLAAGLLLTPGVVTDLIGLSLVAPPTRVFWREGLKRGFRDRVRIVGWSSIMPDGAAPRPTKDNLADDNLADDNLAEGKVVGRDGVAPPPE